MADNSLPDLNELERRMEGALTAMKTEFGGLRTGRASASLLEPVMVSAYGAEMPLNQVATVNVPEPRMLSVAVWDKTMVGAVEKAIRDAGLGVNPITDGQTVRVPMPALTEERRKELAKVAAKYAEAARVAIRNIRRDGMEAAKKAEGVSEDDQKKTSENIQKLTDQWVKSVDETLAHKEEEIMQV
jgi:ribosome recycling factor